MTGNQAFALQQVIVGMGWIWAICEAWSCIKNIGVEAKKEAQESRGR
jgi:hypothetical protein